MVKSKFVGPGPQDYNCVLATPLLAMRGNRNGSRKKNPRVKDNGQAPFNSLADVLTDSNECLTRVVDLIHKSVALHVDSARMLITFSLQ